MEATIFFIINNTSMDGNTNYCNVIDAIDIDDSGKILYNSTVPTSITLNKSSLALPILQSEILIATITPSYSIIETVNIKPFISRTQYIVHDKIASFEVNQYTTN